MRFLKPRHYYANLFAESIKDAICSEVAHIRSPQELDQHIERLRQEDTQKMQLLADALDSIKSLNANFETR